MAPGGGISTRKYKHLSHKRIKWQNMFLIYIYTFDIYEWIINSSTTEHSLFFLYFNYWIERMLQIWFKYLM